LPKAHSSLLLAKVMLVVHLAAVGSTLEDVLALLLL
jgi:hypothetical protein